MDRTTSTAVGATTKASPKGWPRTPTEALWAWMARRRPPLPILVAGAEGGVGTSTTCALVGEIIAAASPGPTVLLNQCGHDGGTLIRRLVGQRAGLPGYQVMNGRRQGVPIPRILKAAAMSSAGAYLVEDGRGFTALRGIYELAKTTCGSLVVDAGRVDLTTLIRIQEIRSMLVLVGRADVAGAEAVCAALRFFQQRRTPVYPVVVLSSTFPTSRRRVQAAIKLVTTAGAPTLVHLPFDAQLTTGSPLRLDRVGKATATAGLHAVMQVGRYHEGYGHAH